MYLGGPVRMLQLFAGGIGRELLMGSNLSQIEKRKGPARKKGDRLPGMKQCADDPDSTVDETRV